MSTTQQLQGDAVARVLTEKEISRRSFLRGTGLVIGVTMAAGAASTAAKALNNPNALDASHTGAVPGPPNAAQIDSWLQVNPDNTVTLFHGVAELGQGTPTAMRQIAAEELGLSMEQVTAAQLDTNVSISAFAVGSGSARAAMGATNMRGAAAAARTALLKLASAQLGVPVSSLSVSKGVVSGGGKTLKYSDLMAGKLFQSTIAAQSATLTDPKQFKVIGTRVPRIDIPNLVNGRATFIQNVRVPGMLHGRVVRPRGQGAVDQGAKLISVDKDSIKHIDGAQVVVVGNFVGVVAPKEWAAIQAAAQLKVKWDETPKLSGNGNLASWLKDPANSAGDAIAAQSGNVGAGIAGATKVVQQSYFTAYQAHVPIGPNAAVADVRGDQATVLCMAQGPYTTRSAIAGALKLPATSVRVQVYPGSSSYGHGTYDDASISAALLSQAVGKPVRVQFMRWDDHGWDQFGPAQVTDIRAGIDASGKIVGYDYASWQHGWTQVVESATQLAGVTPIPATAPAGNADATSAASYYAIPNRRVTSKRVNGYNGFFKGIWLRAPAAPQSLFASEQMIDALAKEAGLDPIAFRIKNIDANDVNGNARWIGVLDAVAKAADWKPKVSASKLSDANVVKGRGVAMGGFANAFPAIIADITVNKKTGKITVDHLYAAQDAGITVNPGLVENQMTGCLVQGVSRALIEEVRFTKKQQTSLDWISYPTIRFTEAPKVTTVVVQRLDQPSAGSGEPSTAAVPAAIANAFFDATGVRLTRMPMTPGYVRGALKAAAASK